MTNVHTPQRGTNESFDAYKARRAQSRELVKTIRRGPTQLPMMPGELSEARFWLGQHTNEKRAERRARVKDHGGIRRFKRLTQLHRPAELPF